MSDIFEKFNTIKKNMKLDAKSKERIRDRLVQYIDASTTEESVEASRQDVHWAVAMVRVFSRPMPIFAALIILVLAGGSVSLAAQKSLPGDVLYPIKVGFNEKVAASLRVSPVEKANYEVDLATRRLEEVSALVSRGAIGEREKTEIETRFKDHAAQAESRMHDIEEGGDVRGAADVASRFEASLKSHGESLSMLEEKDSDVHDIAEKVHTKFGEIMSARVGLESKIAAHTNDTSDDNKQVAKTAAEGKLNAATNALAAAKLYIENKKGKEGAAMTSAAGISATPTTGAPASSIEQKIVQPTTDEKIKEAENLIAQARAKIAAGAYGEAFNLGNEAIRRAQEARKLIGQSGPRSQPSSSAPQ